jgi:large subunit ribosomal protein L9
MDVILRETVKNVGRAGEVVRVKDGYARNFLIPKGLAYAATAANKRRAETESQRLVGKLAAQQGDAEALAAQLAGLELRFTMKAGEGDKLFGSITSADIAARIAERGLTVDKRVIELEEPIKMIGVYQVPIRLHSEVRGEVQVWVDKEA